MAVLQNDTNYDHAFRSAYLEGLTRFISALEQADPKNKVVFKPALHFALSHFGVAAKDLAERLAVTKSTISKWKNSDTMPSQPEREVTIQWIFPREENK